MRHVTSRLPLLPACATGLFLAAPAVHAQLNPAVTPYANRTLFQTGATNANAPATNVVDFQDVTYSAAMGSGFIPTFTKAGFITFKNGNFQHEIIEGTNVGQAGNNVYVTLTNNKPLGVADLTFAAGVFSLGFDFKDAAGNGTAADVPQNFTFSLFSGANSLGNLTLATIPGGTTFTFAGFTSTQPITELLVTSSNNTPNQDFVLDNLAASDPVPEPATAALLGAGSLLGALALVRRRARQSA